MDLATGTPHDNKLNMSCSSPKVRQGRINGTKKVTSFRNERNAQQKQMKPFCYDLAMKELEEDDLRRLFFHWRFKELHVKAIQTQYIGKGHVNLFNVGDCNIQSVQDSHINDTCERYTYLCLFQTKLPQMHFLLIEYLTEGKFARCSLVIKAIYIMFHKFKEKMNNL